MKLDFSFSVTPAACHADLSRRSFSAETEALSEGGSWGPALTFLVWIPASAGMTEEVTQSFFFDQTGRLRPETGLTPDT